MPVFGVRVSVKFHLLYVHIIFNSVWVAEWPSFGKELHIRLTIFLFLFCLFVILVISRFSLEPRSGNF